MDVAEVGLEALAGEMAQGDEGLWLRASPVPAHVATRLDALTDLIGRRFDEEE